MCERLYDERQSLSELPPPRPLRDALVHPRRRQWLTFLCRVRMRTTVCVDQHGRTVRNVKVLSVCDDTAVGRAGGQHAELLRWHFGCGSAPIGLAAAETTEEELHRR